MNNSSLSYWKPYRSIYVRHHYKHTRLMNMHEAMSRPPMRCIKAPLQVYSFPSQIPWHSFTTAELNRLINGRIRRAQQLSGCWITIEHEIGRIRGVYECTRARNCYSSASYERRGNLLTFADRGRFLILNCVTRTHVVTSIEKIEFSMLHTTEYHFDYIQENIHGKSKCVIFTRLRVYV